MDAVAAVDWNVLPVADLLKALERLEIARRKATACACDLAAAVQKSDEAALGTVAHKVMADVMRTTVSEARRRTRDAEQLAPAPP